MKKSIITKIAVSISFFLACGNSFARLSIPKMPTPLKTIIFSKKGAATAAALAALTIFDRTILERTPLFNSLAESAVKRYVQNDTNKLMYQAWLENFIQETISYDGFTSRNQPFKRFDPINDSMMGYINPGERERRIWLARKIELANASVAKQAIEMIYDGATEPVKQLIEIDIPDKSTFDSIIPNISSHVSGDWRNYKKSVETYVQSLEDGNDFYVTLSQRPRTGDLVDPLINAFTVPGLNLFGKIVSAIYWATDKNNPERIFAKQARFRWRIYRELLAKMIGRSYKEPEAPAPGGN